MIDMENSAPQNLETVFQLKNQVKDLEDILNRRLTRIFELKGQVAILKVENESLQKPFLQARITNQRKQLAHLQTAHATYVSRECRYKNNLRAKVEALEARVKELEGKT